MKIRVIYALVFFLVWVKSFQIANGQSNDLELIQKKAESNPKEAYSRLTDLIISYSDTKSLRYGEALYLEGVLLKEFGLYKDAILKLYQAEQIFQTHSYTKGLAELFNVIGQLYYKTKSTSAALQKHQESLRIFESLEDRQGIVQSLGLIGTMHEKLGNYSKALIFQNQAIELLKIEEDSSQLAILFENIGSIYEDLNQFDSADLYFQKAFELNWNAGDSLKLPGNLNNLGDVRRKTNKATEAIPYYQEALGLSIRLGNKYTERSARVDLGKSYADLGEFEWAYNYFASARDLSESIFSEEAARQLALQEFQFEVRKQKTEIGHLEEIHQFEVKMRWLLIGLILSIITMAWIFFSKQQLRIRTSQSQLQKQREILEVKEKLILSEKENINLLESRMSAEVHAQQKALSAQTLHVIEKNQMLKEIQSKLQSTLNLEAKEQKKKLRNLIRQIDYNLSQDSDWESFKQAFENVHHDFLKNLKSKNPELTSGDLKLACLMKMNMSNKEIAATLGISIESLRISRYRLRKRLQLAEGKDLQNYLLGM
ncbi:tetratricopeptide repeat protein [Algoriphagus hitonicola]|uniref:Tetratricopeptide repeat-containing protein n=1 Tax=Algoriphagus hitonicola TaxID=435880 RepID=A0A1I2XIM7_9BACT|nr:tetratricopeptide repeat protein [Algoriphagus hitonicola]SFH13348.1 Tetratricopeptide repeat-containing protein [Algoriphagus hitonicola]